MGASFAAMHRIQVALPATPEVTWLSLFVFGRARQRDILKLADEPLTSMHAQQHLQSTDPV